MQILNSKDVIWCGNSTIHDIPQRKDPEKLMELLDKFFDFIPKEKWDRSSLTIYDLFPWEAITEDLVYDLIYYCVTHVEAFWFKKERQFYLEHVKGKSLSEKRDILKTRRMSFLRNPWNKNKIQPILSKLWDITPHIMMVTKFHHPTEKHLWEKPKNLEEFVKKFAHEHTNKLDSRSRLLRCSFGQTIIAIVRALDADMLDKADKELALIVKKIRDIKGLEITEEWVGYIKFLYRWNGITYSGKFLYRMKRLQKIILKILYNREYADINDQSDLGWTRLILNENPDPIFAQEERIHASKTFWHIIYSNKDEQAEVRIKWEYLSESSKETLFKDPKFTQRGGKNKLAMWNIKNISLISTNANKKLEFQIESPWNMETYFESPEFNDVKKILASASRDKKWINLYSLLLTISLLCPDEYDKKAIINHLLFTKKIIPWFKHSHLNELFFMSTDIYTKEYDSQYGDGIFSSIEFVEDTNTEKNRKDVLEYNVLCELIDKCVKEATFKNLLRQMKGYLINAEQVLTTFSLESLNL